MTFWFWPQMKEGSFRTKREGASTYVSPTAKARHIEHPVHAFSSPAGMHQLGSSQLETSSAGSAGFMSSKNFPNFMKYCWLQTGFSCSLGSRSLLPDIYLRVLGTRKASCHRSAAWAGQTVHASSGSNSIFLSSATSHTDGSCSISHKVLWKYASGCLLMPPNWFVN